MHITPCARSWEPLEVALRLGRLPGLAWLDGGLTHGREGRFSFVAAAPCETRARPLSGQAPYALLDELGADEREAGAVFSSGDVPRWVGYVAYDAAWAGRARRLPAAEQPVVHFARHDAWYAFDHASGQGSLVGDDAAACARLAGRLEAAPLAGAELGFAAGSVSVTDAGRHRAAIREALAAIREGDVYQINLARRFVAPFSGSALGLYLRMRAESPVPLGGFLDAGDHAVLGRSMERFLRFDRAAGTLWTSPIKGTIARKGDDADEARQLVADPKEHAEHAMVVDLMRNDLSRVCEVGSVEVRELMAVLPFRDLAHLVSTVAGRAQPGLGLSALLAHTFPPGSVTGTPKERAVALIEALESEARGVYTGAFGFVDRAGGCSFAVAIRTAVVAGGEVAYHAGGGIVAASDELRETAETELKAAAFVRALGASA